MKTIDEPNYENYGLQVAEPELLDRLSTLPDQDLRWLSGFCLGLARSKPDVNSVTTLAESVSIPKSLILYASQSGNAQSIAESLQEKLKTKNISSDLKSADQLKLKQLKDYSQLFMIASTHGEGDAPDSSIELLELIQSNKAPNLSHIKHAVLSLGDSSYEFFCQTGKDFEQAFLNLNSTGIIQRLDCDLDFEEHAEQWVIDVINHLERLVPVTINNLSTTVTPLSSATIHPIITYDKRTPYQARLLTQQKITAQGSSKDTYHLELSIENSGIQYSVGDSLGVWATNESKLINQVLTLTALEAEQKLVYKNESYGLATLLREKLELTQISRKLLVDYNVIAENSELEKMLESNVQSYIEQHQFVDLLIDYPAEITAQQLVALLNPLKPRLYSIASSQLESEDEVHLTINAVSSENTNGIRQGNASNYLIHRLKEEEHVAIYIDPNPNFRLPEDHKNIILIGPGTGIAPFRAFLQQRDASEASGNNWLFFGNPNFNSDFLYQNEFKQYLTKGLLTKLDLAFSRDQQDKIYVQDRLLENAAEVWQWLEKDEASIYVCGDIKKMAKDVEQTLLTIIEAEGKKSPEQAKEYLRLLRKNKRYQRDVY
jgi:sulfite reductase (NADPH) flavoprotein alpha-component